MRFIEKNTEKDQIMNRTANLQVTNFDVAST